MSQEQRFANEIEGVLMLGSSRKRPSWSEAPSWLLDALPSGSEEVRIMAAAGLLGLAQAAAAELPILPPPEVPPAEPDTRPMLTSGQLGVLHTVIDQEHNALLEELLGLVVARGRQLPASALAELLTVLSPEKSADSAVSPVLCEALGPLGRWLCQVHPQWRELLPPVPLSEDEARTLWQYGTVKQRTALQARLHRESPALARELLRATWTVDAAGARAGFLTTWKESLVANDLAVLEELLAGERSGQVSEALHDLLRHFQDSSVVAKARAIREEWMQVERKSSWLKVSYKVSVQSAILSNHHVFLSSFDAGVTKAAYAHAGSHTLLKPLFAVAGLQGLYPKASELPMLLAALLKGCGSPGQRHYLMIGLIEYAALHQDRQLADVLLPVVVWEETSRMSTELCETASPGLVEQVVGQRLAKQDQAGVREWFVRHLHSHWSAGFSEVVVRYLEQALPSYTTVGNTSKVNLDGERIALACHPSKLPLLVEVCETRLLNQVHHTLDELIDRLYNTAQIRNRLHQEFSS